MRIKLRGKMYDVTKEEIEKKLNKIEPEIGTKFKYYLQIGNKELPVKQVVCKFFNLAKAEITTMEAYQTARKLGFKITERS